MAANPSNTPHARELSPPNNLTPNNSCAQGDHLV